MSDLRLIDVVRFAHRNGFRVQTTWDGSAYVVRSSGSRQPAFIGSVRECHVWLLGYTWNHGAAARSSAHE